MKLYPTLKISFVKVFETIGQALLDCSILQIFSKLWTIIVAVGKCVTSILGKKHFRGYLKQ